MQTLRSNAKQSIITNDMLREAPTNARHMLLDLSESRACSRHDSPCASCVTQSQKGKNGQEHKYLYRPRLAIACQFSELCASIRIGILI